MRQTLSECKVERLREQTGLDIITAKVRGNTDHRIDLYLSDQTILYLYKDGKLKRSPLRWHKND